MLRRRFLVVPLLALLFLGLQTPHIGRAVEELQQVDPVIDNSQFILQGSFFDIDFEREIAEQLPNLETIRVSSAENGEATVPAQFAFYGHFSTVNPFVLVALIEARNGSLANIASTTDLDRLDLGVEGNSFIERLNNLSQLVADEYYEFRDSNPQAATIAVRHMLQASGQGHDKLPELLAGFDASFRQRFGDPLAVDDSFYYWESRRRELENDAAAASLDPFGDFEMYVQADMQLPWSVGESWKFTGGPHSWAGTSTRPWSSVDYAPPDVAGCPGSPPSSYHTKASLYGVVYYVGSYEVKVAHWTEVWEERWESEYFHMSPVYVSYGQNVTPTTTIGRPSCLGGTTTGLHVHFTFTYNGSRIEANHRQLSGWTIHEGTYAYDGTMTKGGTTKNKGDWITK